MKHSALVHHFKHSLAALFSGSNKIERQCLGKIIYQAAPVQSRFTNMAVNIDPSSPVNNDMIEIVSNYFRMKQRSYTWVVNQDDNKNLIELLTQSGFKHMSDIECLYFSGEIDPTHASNIHIETVIKRDKSLLKETIINTFEGAQPESIQLFIDEVYFNPKNRADVFFAYIDGLKKPAAYGTIFYYPDEPLAMLSGAATLPDYRGQGLYRALIQHRINAALAKGYQHFIIEAMANTSAPLCKKFGFKEIFKQQYYVL